MCTVSVLFAIIEWGSYLRGAAIRSVTTLVALVLAAAYCRGGEQEILVASVVYGPVVARLVETGGSWGVEFRDLSGDPVGEVALPAEDDYQMWSGGAIVGGDIDPKVSLVAISRRSISIVLIDEDGRFYSSSARIPSHSRVVRLGLDGGMAGLLVWSEGRFDCFRITGFGGPDGVQIERDGATTGRIEAAYSRVSEWAAGFRWSNAGEALSDVLAPGEPLACSVGSVEGNGVVKFCIRMKSSASVAWISVANSGEARLRTFLEVKVPLAEPQHGSWDSVIVRAGESPQCVLSLGGHEQWSLAPLRMGDPRRANTKWALVNSFDEDSLADGAGFYLSSVLGREAKSAFAYFLGSAGHFSSVELGAYKGRVVSMCSQEGRLYVLMHTDEGALVVSVELPGAANEQQVQVYMIE